MQMMAPPEDAQKERSARIDERFDRVDERILDLDQRVTATAKETVRQIKESREETVRQTKESREETARRIKESREEMAVRFDRVEKDARELKKSVEAVQTSIASLHSTLTRGSFGLAIVFASALLVKGF
ncbi:MAG TPA: hypothetical protein VNC16_03445 [Solirubrobacterales bacterium]|jgi:hypothetical protein|nr:hypothetical protein [Solirubrobacterales bacterium]